MPYEIPQHIPSPKRVIQDERGRTKLVDVEAIDAPKWFKNIDYEDFEFTWDNIKWVIKAGEERELPRYLVNYAAHHLAKKIFKREQLKKGNPNDRLGTLRVIPSPEEEAELVKPMIARNFAEQQVTETKSEEPKKEEENKLKCPQCEFVAKSEFGLVAHGRKHK